MQYPWLYVGAKVVCVDPGYSLPKLPQLVQGEIYVVAEVEERCGEIGVGILGYAGSPSERWGRWIYAARRFKPLHDSSKTIEALKQAMRDHVANASGGMGIKRPVKA